MKVERSIATGVLILGLVSGGIAATADTNSPSPQSPKPTPKENVAAEPTPEQMMANWQKAATPGDQQKVLENFVGNWTSHVRMQLDPSKPAEESHGTAEGRMVLGGRFVHVVHKGTMMGQPFEGMMLSGYDNIAKKYVATWVDNMSTTIVRYDGSYDKNTKKLMMGTQYIDPMTWKPTRSRSVTTFISPASWTYEDFVPGPYGKERVVMTITFTKKA